MTSAARIITVFVVCLLSWQFAETVFAQTDTPTPPPPTGYQITLSDGYVFVVEEVWKQGDEVWFRKGGISKGLPASIVKKIAPLTPAPAKPPEARTAAPEAAPKPATPPEPFAIWIYLNGGGRFRVQEVNETADGAWYKSGNIQMFLDRERIVRIEREQPETAPVTWRGSGWTSGNDGIDNLIKINAARFGVDPYLVFCVIEQESHFKTFARSPKGAQGLMQLMPGTARRLGVRRPYDAAENITGGVRYLKELLTMFGGRIDLVLASYNAGEGAVMKYGRNVPPYRETREYVKKIGKRYGIDGRKPQDETDAPVPQR
ncbi:MAG TPA: lytic transglycosylase domain-containing protein [Pyrinomonadaceae bacterium]|nr:lytic transglycosylase domain-containing protein [Pyrinomonadaceae bacterium]